MAFEIYQPQPTNQLSGVLGILQQGTDLKKLALLREDLDIKKQEFDTATKQEETRSLIATWQGRGALNPSDQLRITNKLLKNFGIEGSATQENLQTVDKQLSGFLKNIEKRGSTPESQAELASLEDTVVSKLPQLKEKLELAQEALDEVEGITPRAKAIKTQEAKEDITRLEKGLNSRLDQRDTSGFKVMANQWLRANIDAGMAPEKAIAVGVASDYLDADQFKEVADSSSPTGFSYQDLSNPQAPPIPGAPAPAGAVAKKDPRLEQALSTYKAIKPDLSLVDSLLIQGIQADSKLSIDEKARQIKAVTDTNLTSVEQRTLDIATRTMLEANESIFEAVSGEAFTAPPTRVEGEEGAAPTKVRGRLGSEVSPDIATREAASLGAGVPIEEKAGRVTREVVDSLIGSENTEKMIKFFSEREEVSARAGGEIATRESAQMNTKFQTEPNVEGKGYVLGEKMDEGWQILDVDGNQIGWYHPEG